MAALASHHDLYQSLSLGRVVDIKNFLKGVFRLRPPRKEIVPRWELGLVLEALCEEPFEPASEASLQAWTLKTAFLLAITSAARVSELQALDSHDDLCRLTKFKASLNLNPSFLPKVVNVVYINRQIELDAFYPNPRSRLNKHFQLMCPVRALRIYLDKTKNVRKDRQLLVSYQSGRQGHKVSKSTVARWIRQTIVFAYSQQGKELPPRSVRAHQTRAMSTSFADIRGVTPADLCSAATWSSSSVFARHYRLDVSAGNSISTQVLSAAVAVRRPR